MQPTAIDLHITLLNLDVRRVWFVFSWDEHVAQNEVVTAVVKHSGLACHWFSIKEEDTDPRHLLVYVKKYAPPYLPHQLTHKQIGRMLGFPIKCVKEEWRARFQFAIFAQEIFRDGSSRWATFGPTIYVTSYHCDSLTEGFKHMSLWAKRLAQHDVLLSRFRFSNTYYARS